MRVHIGRESTILQSSPRELSTAQHQQNKGAKKEAKIHPPVYISGAEVEQVNRFRLFEITITENLENLVHHTYLPWLKRHRKGFISNENLRRLNSGAIF